MNALSKITSNDITTERNEVLQGIVVDSSYVKQIETEAFVFYTMFVYPNEPQDDLNKFKNLLAKEDKNGDDIDFYMIEYAPNSSLQYTAADGGSIIIPGDGEIYLDFIGSNNETNSTGMLDNCTFTADICINTKQGGIGPPHVKGPGCTDQSKIYTFSWSMCNLGENPGDENPADYLDLSFTDGETSVGGSRRTVPPYIGVPEEDPDLATEPVNLYVQNNFVNNLEPELKNWWDFTAADDQQKQEQKDAIEAFLLEHLDSSQPNGFEPEAEAFAEEAIKAWDDNPDAEVDFEEEIINELTGKADCIYKKLKQNSTNFSDAINNFDGEFPVSHLNFSINNSLPSGNYGVTNPPNNYMINIEISNTQLSNVSDLGAAIAFVHEVIHAEIFRKMLSAAQTGDLDPGNMTTQQQIDYVNSLRENFPGIYDYYRERYKPTWNHNMMAQHYIEIIADMVEEFDNSSQPRQVYEDISWAGLREIEVLNNSIAWDNLSSTDQSRILNNLSQHFFNGPNNCN